MGPPSAGSSSRLSVPRSNYGGFALKIALHYDPYKAHQKTFLELMATGMRACGDDAKASDGWEPADVLAFWSSKHEQPSFHDGPILYLECGFLHRTAGDYARDRQSWISLGWDGVAGNARPIPESIEIGPERWAALSAALAMPLADPREVDTKTDHLLLCLQHPGDQAARGADFAGIEARLAEIEETSGMPVRVREHPIIARRNSIRQPPLSVDLENCGLCVTYNSTSAVEAVVRGVPTVAMHERSPAYEVAAHSLDDPWAQWRTAAEGREAWAHRLAYRQWTHSEIRDGTAWEFMRACLDAQ